MNKIINTTILLFLIMDPIGNLPVFMSILKNLNRTRQIIVLCREMFIALILMILFLFGGEHILLLLNLKTESVSIAGGIILYLIAINMIFPVSDTSNILLDSEEPFIVPLAIPLIAGPSLLATLMLLSHQYTNQMQKLIYALLVAWISTVVILLLSSFFLRLLGDKGVNALERLMGLVLIMIATQMFLDGIRSYLTI
ncbi:YhgN family NAAT transporter [Candidatus Ishikawella capsulata]|uniref:UPF0056 membrane protein n=1 Tax=Candidatus Ishikawaella capsulata Mpkobe TaxID=476281 RepID=C5WCE3_9ENTR|nr:YhgN family NAAT transporter [Candidatus Ishikawaella capsulata]BAH82999.1 predicted antibiotic transporter [Candidatus Ishikawaella capsulata Mpkobe]